MKHDIEIIFAVLFTIFLTGIGFMISYPLGTTDKFLGVGVLLTVFGGLGMMFTTMP